MSKNPPPLPVLGQRPGTDPQGVRLAKRQPDFWAMPLRAGMGMVKNAAGAEARAGAQVLLPGRLRQILGVPARIPVGRFDK